MIEIELEKTYLAKCFPKDLFKSPNKELIDIYLPKESKHPTLRIRKRGDSYEMTKKSPVNNDSSEQTEHTIKLTEEEYKALESVSGKKVRKIRYYYNKEGLQAEVDVFQDDLEGLVLIDFEFKEIEDKNSFEMPDFCLIDVTQEDTIAGGMLCGKKYADIEPRLTELGYKKVC